MEGACMKIEVKEVREGEIIHLGLLVNKEQTRAVAGQVCSGLLAPLAGESILGPCSQPRGFLLQRCYMGRGKAGCPQASAEDDFFGMFRVKEGLLQQLRPRSTHALEHLLDLGVQEGCWQMHPEDIEGAEHSKNDVIPK